ncbi:MAG: glycosyltransferase family 4 protein, partial [Alphaproteobacteria bacterium]
LIRAEGVDIVHARSRAPAWSARAAAQRTGRPLVTTFHGVYNAGNYLKRCYNAIMTKGDRVIAISDFIAEHIDAHYRVDPARVTVIHRGVDLDVFDPRKVPPPRLIQLAEKWRLPDGAPVIMLPGRLTRWKGQAVFLEAIKRLGRDDIGAVLLGSDQGRVAYRSELEDLVRKRGLEKIVRFVDDARDMSAALMLADVVVSASTDPEAFGRVIAEAQAMGRPVVATNHGGARETVIEGSTGWLVPPRDPDALAAAMAEALSLDASARQRLARDAISHVRSHFSKQVMGERTLAVYAGLLRQARR